MPSYGPEIATCEVLAFREGLLSKVGHDLLLRATAFEIAIDPAAGSVTADIDASSLQVAMALRDGRALPGALSPSDTREIEAIVADKILRARRFPTIRFVSTEVSRRENGYEVRGSLSLAGTTRNVLLPVRRDAHRLATEVRLHQPDFGIRPYTAALGALKVKPDVVVRASVPADTGR